MKTSSILLLSLALLVSPVLSAAPKHGPQGSLDSILRWNKIAIDASGYDHAHAREQLGPGRASRAMAIAHIAIFDAANAVVGGFESYGDVTAGPGPMSFEAAVAQAAHDALVSLFPSQAADLDALLAEDLAKVKNKNALINGINLGKLSAATCLLSRVGDGSEVPEPFLTGLNPWITSDLPGHWRMDPISQLPIVLGGHWGECAPFVLESSSQFRVPPFPAMTSPEYTAAYNEVKRVGGDGVTTPTERTVDETIAGIFWAYDGTPSLCAPPRLFNQIAAQIAGQMGSGAMETAQLLVLVNVAMADATLTCWESKYYYDIWRPVTGIRESDLGAGDGNPDTIGDPTFSPLGAPASNISGGKNFTPPFPAYPSGHASMGGALFQTLRRFYGTDNIPFTFVSDELNGVTTDNQGNVRPLIPRSFSTLSQAEDENGQSRIYLGIHWSFDKNEGIAMGRRVADYIFDNAFGPLPPRR
ncbi:MAG TPA: chloroperoxidase [Candidatus Angelobacter sp.]|nr:chloroperoxidase [Candidatus Angelobacter sp.]